MTTSPPSPVIARPRRRQARLSPILFGLIVLAAAGVAWVLLRRPRLEFSNTLGAPISVVAGESASVRIPPGGTHSFPASRGSTLVVQWSLVRPLSANNRPMGEEIRGSLVIPQPKGTMQRLATVWEAGDYFAPLITNRTDQLLRVTVNAGLEGALDCGCAVRPGARRVFIGYYRLYRNSTVRAQLPNGISATFQDLGPKVTARDGTVGLRFESKDFR